MLDQITPVILTYNEAPNLERTLRQVSWAREIVIVDSYSDDETLDIAANFSQARVVQRHFDSHAAQWTFALTQTGIQTEWVLALDADYVVSDELIEELKSLQPDPTVNGYTVDFTYWMNGKPLRSGIYPSVTALYRRKCASYFQDGHTHRVNVTGKLEQLLSRINHDDRKPLRRWLDAQVKYAALEARKLQTTRLTELSLNDRIRRWRIFAPCLVLIYCLLVRGGVFDGWAGFCYAFQRTLAELMLSLHLFELPLPLQRPAITAEAQRE